MQSPLHKHALLHVCSTLAGCTYTVKSQRTKVSQALMVGGLICAAGKIKCFILCVCVAAYVSVCVLKIHQEKLPCTAFSAGCN